MGVCSCGRRWKRAEKFCPECGSSRVAHEAAIGAAESAANGATKPARRGAGRQAARFSDPERKHVAVLFADVCGSTRRIAKFDPEEARGFLDRALEIMKTAVAEYGGTISQTLGDGVLALFGAPNAQEDYVLRACLAAQDIQRRTIDWNRNVGDDERSFSVRAGIDCGEVVVSGATEFLASHYRADGVPVHVARRLEQAAAPGSVVVSDRVFRQIEHRLAAASLGVRQLDGIDEDIELFELAQRSAVASLAGRPHTAPLVGRRDLLAALGSISDQVRGGLMRAVGLRGEAGAGKTRLITEFCSIARADGFGVCFVSAHGYTSHVQYSVVADLMKELSGAAAEAAGPSGLPESSDAPALRGADPRVRAAAIDLLGLGDPGPVWKSLTPSQRRRHIADALKALVAARASQGPLLLVVEDLQRADRESQRMLEQLMRGVESLPLLLCVSYRDGFQPTWAESSWFSEHWVRLLERGELLLIVREILGADPSLEFVLNRLVEKAEGNPFYLEQMVMTLIDDGTLVGAPGAYRCVRTEARIRIPASIAVVIGSRVDRLPVQAKATLEAAAIIGDPFSSELVASMRGAMVAEIDGFLSLARDAGLIAATLAEDPDKHTFRHALVQEVVARALTQPRRKALHRAAFSALRLQSDAGLPDQAGVLAHHAFHGEAWTEAAEFATRSMARSIARSANRDALGVFDLGMEAARRVASDEVRRGLELGLLTETLGALLPLGRADEIVDNLGRAGDIARALGDPRREAVVLLQLATMLWTGGRYAQGHEVARQAAAAAESAGSRSLQMAAVQARMMLSHGLGHYEEVLQDAREVEAGFAAELGARRIMAGWAVLAAVNVKVFLADVLAKMDQFELAQQACDAAYRELEGQDHAFSRMLVDVIQGGIWIEQGKYSEAVALLQAALQSSRSNDVPTMYPPIYAALEGATALAGDSEQAAARLRKAIDSKLHLAGGRYNEYYLSRYLATALSINGRHDEALAAAEEARRAAALNGQRGHEVEALFLAAEIEMKAGTEQTALEHLKRVRDLARALSMRLVERRSAECIERIASTQGGATVAAARAAAG